MGTGWSRHQARRRPVSGRTRRSDSSEYEVVTVQDVLDDCARAFRALLAREAAARGQYRELRDAQAPDLHGLARMVQGMDDTLDMMGLLYLEEYIPAAFCPWRECYAARGFTIQEPAAWTRHPGLHGRAAAGAPQREALYVEAATALDPDLFAVRAPR